jgi:hypothetical protein
MPFVRHAYRDELFLKLFGASRLGPDAIAEVVAVQREAYLGELAALGELRKQHRADPLVSLLIEAAILHTKADLRVIELAEGAAEKLASRIAEPVAQERPDTQANQA